MLTAPQAQRLKQAGLDYYNHNLDTSPDYYRHIISTRTYQDRLDTLGHVREAGIHVCCGGIVGMGESEADRIGMIHALATLPEHPESVPINALVAVEGTPAAKAKALDGIDFVRTIAVARITMPASMVRLSAGRDEMSDETQALCFLAGANSIFYGEKLLTTPNPAHDADKALFARLGLTPMPAAKSAPETNSALTAGRYKGAHVRSRREPMKQLIIGLGILLLGALVLSPAIAYLGLDPMPGDIVFQQGNMHIVIPVIYSLCASGGLALLYYFLKG